jgi:hypothetical protein
MTAISIRRTISKVHYWAGWGLGLFALAWFGSGFFMTLKPIEQIRGNHIAAEPSFSVSAENYQLPSIGEARSISLIDALGTPAFVIRSASGRTVVNAQTGATLPVPTEAQIKAKAESVLLNEASVVKMSRLDAAPMDYAGPLPVWQVTISEPTHARLYIDALTGQLVRVRTTRWRWFDIAWRIHILDPAGERISSWWLSLSSGLAALFALSGLALLWRPRRSGRP